MPVYAKSVTIKLKLIKFPIKRVIYLCLQLPSECHTMAPKSAPFSSHCITGLTERTMFLGHFSHFMRLWPYKVFEIYIRLIFDPHTLLSLGIVFSPCPYLLIPHGDCFFVYSNGSERHYYGNSSLQAYRTTKIISMISSLVLFP